MTISESVYWWIVAAPLIIFGLAMLIPWERYQLVWRKPAQTPRPPRPRVVVGGRYLIKAAIIELVEWEVVEISQDGLCARMRLMNGVGAGGTTWIDLRTVTIVSTVHEPETPVLAGSYRGETQ